MQLWFVGEKEYRRARKKENEKFQNSVMELELKELEECNWIIYHFSEQDDMEAKAKLCSEDTIVLGTVGRKQ